MKDLFREEVENTNLTIKFKVMNLHELNMRTVKDKYRDDFSNGWYIEQSLNCRSSISEKIELFAMKKDNEDGTKSIRYYFAKDVVRILVDECGAVVVKNKTLSVWLNDNPFNYKPKKGCKISFHNEDETINLLN